jgi:hypothetical protein
VHPQIVGLDVASLTVLSSTHVRTVVVVDHRVADQSRLYPERFTAARDLAMERPLTGVCPPVIHEVVLLCESGPTARSITFVRSLASVGSFVLGGTCR